MWGKPLHPKAFRIIQGPRYRQSEKDNSRLLSLSILKLLIMA